MCSMTVLLGWPPWMVTVSWLIAVCMLVTRPETPFGDFTAGSPVISWLALMES